MINTNTATIAIKIIICISDNSKLRMVIHVMRMITGVIIEKSGAGLAHP